MIAMALLPTCRHAEDILDFWRHPVLDLKMLQFRVDCVFLGQPLQIVALGIVRRWIWLRPWWLFAYRAQGPATLRV